MDSLRCSNCSLLNFATATACKRCGLPFESAGTTGDSQPYASSETYPQASEGQSFFWDQPSYRPTYAPPPPPAGSNVKKLVGVFVGLAVLSLIAFIAIPKLLSAKKSDLSKLSWSEYRAPDGTFTISLPVAPKELTLNQMTPVGNVKVHTLEADVSKDGGCMMMYADYPTLSDMSVDTLYESALKGMERRSQILSIGARKFIMHDGYQGLEVELKPSARNLRASAVARIFWIAPRLYVLLAGGPDTPDYKALQTRCLDSLKFSKGR